MEFHKWPKIESLENERMRNSRAYQKALKTQWWTVTEKIDGTNIAVNITRDGYELSSRNQMLGKGTTFYGIQTAVHQLEPLVEIFQKAMEPGIVQFSLQGEFFGTKVMSRIDYRIPQAFRFFGAYSIHEERGYERWPFCLVEYSINSAGYSFMLVPVIGHFRFFEEAVAVSEERASFFNPDAKAEGIVIQSSEVPLEPYGLIFKKKRADFAECRLRKVHEDAENGELAELNAEFKNYLTINRMVNLFTKMGPPAGRQDAGRYIGEFLADAFGDFSCDRGELALSAGELKAVKSAGPIPYQIFCEACAKAGIEF